MLTNAAGVLPPTLNADVINSDRPILNLSFISKLVERIVATSKYSSYLSRQSALLPSRPQYCLYTMTLFSPLTTLLIVLDLSAAVLLTGLTHISLTVQSFALAGSETVHYPLDCSIPQRSLARLRTSLTSSNRTVLSRQHSHANNSQLLVNAKLEDISWLTASLMLQHWGHVDLFMRSCQQAGISHWVEP